MGKKRLWQGGWGLAILAAGAIAWGGTKPEPPTPPQPSNRVETVIIVTPLGDGMYNTKRISIDKSTITFRFFARCGRAGNMRVAV